MRVAVNRAALSDALNLAANVSATRSPQPAVTAIKLDASDSRLKVMATDCELFFSGGTSQVQVESEGAVLVAADKLRDCVNSLVDDTLSLHVIENQIEIRGNDSRFKLFTAAKVEAFPPAMTDDPGSIDVTLTCGALRRLASLVAFAAARESTRYAFNGVLLAVAKGVLRMVATDGRRLAMVTVKDAAYADKKAAAIVPIKAMKVLDKILASVDASDVLTIRIGARRVSFMPEGGPALTTNLVEGGFPPYEDVIPRDADKRFTCSRVELLSAVRRAGLLTTEESKGITFSFSKKGVVLNSRDASAGEATVNLAAKFDGGDIEIGFNPTFVADALRVADSDEVTLELTSPNRPGLLKAGADFQYVIMPVNRQ